MAGHMKVPSTAEIMAAKKSKKTGKQLLDNAKYFEHGRGSNETPVNDLKANNLKGKMSGYQDFNKDHLKGTFGKRPPNEIIGKKGK